MDFCEVCFGNKSDSNFSTARLATAYAAIAAQALRAVAHYYHAVVVTAFGVFPVRRSRYLALSV
ncbi:hypothetical protein [Citrobacter freundii]|uniref:Uncharacterized protein n=1 Tax=Citrobacter freundii TaxID=546 RepID=A0A7G2J0C8_CITFR|nr:hypothetical protein [Citrobacter freundii]